MVAGASAIIFVRDSEDPDDGTDPGAMLAACTVATLVLQTITFCAFYAGKKMEAFLNCLCCGFRGKNHEWCEILSKFYVMPHVYRFELDQRQEPRWKKRKEGIDKDVRRKV